MSHFNHDENCNCEQRDEAREKLMKAVEEYVATVHQEQPMVLCASLVYETTTIDPQDQRQQYGFTHVMLGNSAMSTHVGLLRLGENRLVEYMNRREE